MTSTAFTFVIRSYKNREYIDETLFASTRDAIADIVSGQIDADSIVSVIEIDLIAGTSKNVTGHVALEVWRSLDADNSFAWREMRDWLETFGHDCEHLDGESKDLARDFYGR